MFQSRVYCHKCGWTCFAILGTAHHTSVYYNVCPDCGKVKVEEMTVLPCKWVDERNWLEKLFSRPDHGYWQTENGHILTTKRGSKLNENF